MKSNISQDHRNHRNVY